MTDKVRETRRVDELKTGDWLAGKQIHGDDDQPTEVLDVHPFASDPSAALLVYRTISGRPDSIPSSANITYELATEAEVDEAADDVRRDRIATQLRMLADLMVSKRLPIPGPYNIAHVTFNFGRHIEQVDRVAELLGIEREIAYGTATVKLPAAEGLLSIGWDAYAPKAEPKPLTPEPIAEHYETSGWKGEEPGTCGIRCACGVAYDGFDTLAEAKELLDRHIADPTEPDADGPSFKVGDRVVGHNWQKSKYAERGLNVIGTVVETKTIAGSNPARQQFRAEGADWCGSGSMWNHSDDYELAPNADDAEKPCHGCGTPPGGLHATACGIRPWAQR